MSEYAKNIQTIEDLWKKRIELQKLTEVVRCRDCKHYGLGRRCDWSCRFVKPDGFCAWAERREP